MKAALLAAGLGTRLRPLTDKCPKALVPVLNRPLLALWLARLEAAGCVQVAINTHHLGELVLQFLNAGGPWGMNLQVSPEPELLGTGGGLRDLGKLLGGGPFLAVNGDILTDLDLGSILAQHQDEALTTLVLHDCQPYNNVWVNGGGGLVTGIGASPGSGAGAPLAYTGVQVVSPRMFQYLPDRGPYNLVTAWREAIAAGEKLATVVVTGHFWQDLGTPEAYLRAHQRLLLGEAPGLSRFLPALSDPLLGDGAVLEPGAVCAGGVCLGAGVRVGEGARLRNTVAWERAQIAPQMELENCIVAAGARVTDSARDAVLV
jgi:mannose-1-phosphate guanylyltransferase